jgi:rhodanese-related sulfurtransferase
MKKALLIVASLFTLALAGPARADAAADPALVGAVDKVLANLPNDWYAMEPAAAQQLVENAKPFLLDVRETHEIQAQLPGSTNVSVRALAKSLDKLPQSKAAPILVYCKTGYRGGISVTALRLLGYTNVKTIKGGLDAWEKAGFKVDKVEKKS